MKFFFHLKGKNVARLKKKDKSPALYYFHFFSAPAHKHKNIVGVVMYCFFVFFRYMTVNLYSVTALTASFLKLFTQGERCIVNITSLYGIQPGKGLVHYCVGKASREMYFKVLATENPELNILNYSPGELNSSN